MEYRKIDDNGNVVRDDNGQLFHHTHALFSFKKQDQHGMAGEFWEFKD
jgi:hypothetical protein